MLPRARTAPPGSLTDDPVVPLLPRRRILGLPFGDARSVRRGGRADTIGSRPYRPGDDPRRIDRHASARLSSVKDTDELIVRQQLAEERIGVGLYVDPSRTMTLHSPSLPWLHKPAVVAEVARVVTASAYRTRSRLVRLERLPTEGAVRDLGTGSIVFLVSDFLVFPTEDLWADAAARGWDVVPVIVQDPTWEQSFPEVGGVCLPLADPDGRRRPVLLRRADALARRTENEARLAEILRRLEELALEPILLGTSDADVIYDALLAWSDARRSALAWSG
jgi:uncharacterized protein DUF58